MPLQDIELLLKKEMGLHSSTVGSSTVSQAVEKRMRVCGIQDANEYRNILRHSSTELDALIESVVIPETWFYRDRNPFMAFTDWLQSEWIPGNSVVPLRVLSIPCSTGEEPYTLAMCMADCGLPANAAHIDAIDISSTNIEKARKAQYGANSFRGGDLAFRDRHFKPRGPHYSLNEDIRSRVKFNQTNILDEDFSSDRAPYHVIFCRNLLIYFDRPTQHSAIDRLNKLLTQDGMLFLGHSETSLLLDRPFEPLNYQRCFGFRRTRTEQQEITPCRSRPKRKNPQPCTQSGATVEPATQPFAKVAMKAGVHAGGANDLQDTELLQQAFRLADQGHLDEAANRCEMLLQRQACQADAHYLLGLIREAAGNITEAGQMFRKCIYLNPDHYEALTHLGIICRQLGDTQNANRFHERATRVRQRNQAREVKA